MDKQAVLAALTPELYERFKQAVALRKWPNGQRLTAEQINTCMQAILVWEHTHLPAEARTGFVPPKETACADESHIHTYEQPVRWTH